MAGINTTLQTILDSRLQSAGLGVDIVFNNMQYQPTNGNAWIRPTLLPAKTTTFTLDTTYRHQGIYQIDIYVPSNSGMKQLYDLLDFVTAAYKSNISLAANMFVQDISRGRSERQDAWFTSFIQIDYLYYAI